VLQRLFYRAAFGLLGFGLACKPETTVFVDVVDHPRPFFVAQAPIQPCHTQLPQRLLGRNLLLEKVGTVDQAFAFEQASQFQQPPGAAA
jgi:hypothetical protein